MNERSITQQQRELESSHNKEPHLSYTSLSRLLWAQSMVCVRILLDSNKPMDDGSIHHKINVAESVVLRLTIYLKNRIKPPGSNGMHKKNVRRTGVLATKQEIKNGHQNQNNKQLNSNKQTRIKINQHWQWSMALGSISFEHASDQANSFCLGVLDQPLQHSSQV